MAKPETHPRRIVHVTEAPLGGVVTYLDELLSLQIKMMPDTAIDLIEKLNERLGYAQKA